MGHAIVISEKVDIFNLGCPMKYNFGACYVKFAMAVNK